MSEETTSLELGSVVQEISVELAKMDRARDQIKEIIKDAADELGIDKKLIRKVSRLYHKKSISAFSTEASQIEELYSQVSAK